MPDGHDSLPRAIRRQLADAGLHLAGRQILALCSGGGDSVALVDLLSRLSKGSAPAGVTVLFCDHGLREVEADRAAAARIAALHGHDFVERSTTGLAGSNLQARARAWRYEAAEEVARERGCDLIATGHTADDQLETLLLGLVTSSGVRSWRGMSACDGALVRPLLGVARVQLRQYLVARELAWVDDPSNTNLDFRRNAVRTSVVPALLDQHPGAGVNLRRSHDQIGHLAEALDGLAGALLPTLMDSAGCLNIASLAAFGPPARAELIAAWLRSNDAGRALTSAALRRIDALADAPIGSRVEIRGACVVRGRYHLALHSSHATAHRSGPGRSDAIDPA